MRVVAGSARGVRLTAPRGTATRPITDRVKEALFAILGERVPGSRVVDLYAGSGAFGIEALSRGAASADFVERDRAALVAIRANLERTRLGDGARVHAEEVERFLGVGADGPWHLAFFDPPYGVRAMVQPLRLLLPRLAGGGSVVIKHIWRTELEEVAGLVVERQRRFGETMLTFLTAEDG